MSLAYYITEVTRGKESSVYSRLLTSESAVGSGTVCVCVCVCLCVCVCARALNDSAQYSSSNGSNRSGGP